MRHLPVSFLVLLVAPFLFFFGGSLAVIFAGSFLILPRSQTRAAQISVRPDIANVYNLFSSPPRVLGAFTADAQTADAQEVVIEQFFAKYKSPLAPYAAIFVDEAQKYKIPWELLPAISMQESTGGKNVPEECFNPFGWGIHARGTLCFESWQEGIEKVAKGIKESYVDKGLVTVEQIMSKYNPISFDRDGSWGNGVQYFLQELESFNTP